MLILLLVGGLASNPCTLAVATEVAALHPRQRDFATWRFGLFLHFNVSTFADSEWANGHEDPALFAPTELDCGQWADAAKAAGMSYAILTVKHTGGWCLAPSCVLVANNAHNLRQSDVLSYEWPLTPQGKASKLHGLPGHTGMLPPDGNQSPAELCDTLQTQARWFWHPGLGDADLQSVERMAETYRLSRERNANYLLNVPPDRDGLIPGKSVQRLRELGRLVGASPR